MFVALGLDKQCRHDIETKLAVLRKRYPVLRWTRAANLHLTMAFMGDMDETGLSALDEAVCKTSRNFSRFTYTIQGIHFFPSIHNPNVVALGVSEGAEKICLLSDSLEQNFADPRRMLQYNFRPKENRPFVPHITAARKGNERVSLKDMVVPEISIPVEAEGLSIFSSELNPSGVVYQLVSYYEFNISDN